MTEIDTKLLEAARRGDLEGVNIALTQGANVNAQDSDGYTALHVAAFEGHAQVVERLLRVSEIDVNTRNLDGYTALHLAALRSDDSSENIQVVEALAEHPHCDVDAKTRTNGDTALHLAAVDGRANTVHILIQNDANASLTNDNEDTALHLAVLYKRLGVVSELLGTQRIDVDAKDGNGYTSLQLAILLDNAYAVGRLLRDKRTNISMVNDAGENLLHFASRVGNAIIVGLLCNELPWALTYAANNNGQTALHLASENGHLEVVRRLLIEGLDFNARDRQEKTPLDVAKTPEIRALLLEAANPTRGGAVGTSGLRSPFARPAQRSLTPSPQVRAPRRLRI